MTILKSFVNDIFERIATEASSAHLDGQWWILVANLLSCRADIVPKEVDHLVTQDPNLGPLNPAWRAVKARDLGRYKIGDQVPVLWKIVASLASSCLIFACLYSSLFLSHARITIHRYVFVLL